MHTLSSLTIHGTATGAVDHPWPALHGWQGLAGIYRKFVNQIIEVIDGWTQAVGQACCAALMDHGTDYPHHSLRLELQRSGARSRLIAILLACAAMLQPDALFADMIPVRHTEGLIHGFLVVRTLEGKASPMVR